MANSSTRSPIQVNMTPVPLTANGSTPALQAIDFKNILIQLSAQGGANFTVRVKAAFQETRPDFTVASSAVNPWFYLGTWNLDSITTVAGSAGVAFAADGVVGLLINTDGVTWLGLELAVYASGSLQANLLAAMNE